MNKSKERRSGEIEGKLARERGRKMREKVSERSKGEEKWGDKGKTYMGEGMRSETKAKMGSKICSIIAVY